MEVELEIFERVFEKDFWKVEITFKIQMIFLSFPN